MKWIDRLKKTRHNLHRNYYCHLPIQNNKIILWANSFKQYGCNPKYITEYIMKKYPGVFDLVWVFEHGVKIPDDLKTKVRIVYYFSMEYIKELHTAKFIICNMRTSEAYYWKKRREQIYIQTWHSSLRLKKIEGDAIPFLTSDYIENAKEDSKKIDLLISGCEFSTQIFQKAFWYKGEILKSGTPRCDVLLNNIEEKRKKVFDYYNISLEKKLILYAPTFRSNKESDFLGMDFKKLIDFLGENWVIGARLHPNILDMIEVKDAISMSKYSDMQELIVAADILITDFSSCMFDMAIAKKPCILYAEDLEEYISNERELYFDIKKLPFPITRNMNDLCMCIKKFDKNKYYKDLSIFMEKIGSYEHGDATEKVCTYIYENM